MQPSDPVILVPYDPCWPRRFEEERGVLDEVFTGVPVRIEHIGSTAVPGLGAKPIIDILLGVGRIREVEERIPLLESRGYEYIPKWESVLPERRFFAKPRAVPRTHHLHCVETRTEFWRRHLLFRDLLRDDAALTRAYHRLKLELAGRYRDDREAYTDAKTAFIESVLRDAAGQRI